MSKEGVSEDPVKDSSKEDESDYLIPGIPDDSTSSLKIVKSSNASKASKSVISVTKETSSTRGSTNGTERSRGSQISDPASSLKIIRSSNASKTSKIESAISVAKETSSRRGSTNGDSKSDEGTLGDQSKLSEIIEMSQELSLSGKKSSLDKLDQVQRPRSNRLHRQCQRRFREIIGKREIKNEELEKQQGDLKQRLNILECSMPAVMVWNIWRMSQGASVPSIQRVLEKQFQGPASGEVYCPSTPSRHFDCRVREIEAERKQAQKRVEEARTLWAEKMAALAEREKRLEEAKKRQEEQKQRIQELTAEVQKLKEAKSVEEDDDACMAGDCGVIECKKKWLEKVPSSASIKSTDVMCLEKLQQLAEAELNMKRQIADLERREEDYMRTLQQADELWARLEGDAAGTLQEQLTSKTAANQQMADRICQLEDELEKLRTRMATCRSQLEKFMSIEKIEALIGRDDDFADVVDEAAEALVSTLHRTTGGDDDFADVDEKDVLYKEETTERETLAKPDVDEAGLAIHPEDFAVEEQKLMEAADYLARLGSLSALDADDDYVCPPEAACQGLVDTETGLTDEEMTALREKRVTARELLEREIAKIEGREIGLELPGYRVAKAETEGPRVSLTSEEAPEEFQGEVLYEGGMIERDIVEEYGVTGSPVDETDRVEDGEPPGDKILVLREDMLAWQGNVSVIRRTIMKCPECLTVKEDADILRAMLAQYTGTPAKESVEDVTVKKEPDEEMAPMESAEIEVKAAPEDEVVTEIEEVGVKVAEAEDEAVVIAEEVAESIEIEKEVEEPTLPEIEAPAIEVEPTSEKSEVKIDEEEPTTVMEIDEVAIVDVDVIEPSVEMDMVKDREDEPVRILDKDEPELIEEVKTVAREAIEEETPIAEAEISLKKEDIEVEVPPVMKEEAEVKVKEKVEKEEEIGIEELLLRKEKELELEATVEEKVTVPVKEVEVDVGVIDEEEIPVPTEEKVEIEVKVIPKKEDIPVAEEEEVEAIPGKEEVIEVDVEVVPEKKEIPTPEEVEVDIEVKSEPKKDEILASEEEVVDVEVKTVPVEEEIPVAEDAEAVDIEVKTVPVEEEIPAPEDAEEVDVEVKTVPVEEELPASEEEIEVDVEVKTVPEEEEIPAPEEEVEVDVEVKTVPEEEEIPALEEEEEQVDVEVEIIPEEGPVPEEEEGEMDVDVEIIPEGEEEPVPAEEEEERVDVEVEITPEEEEIPEKEMVEEQVEAEVPEKEEETKDDEVEIEVEAEEDEVVEVPIEELEEIEKEVKEDEVDKDLLKEGIIEEPEVPIPGEPVIVPPEIAISEEVSLPCVCEEAPSVSSGTSPVEVDETLLPCVCEDAPCIPEMFPAAKVDKFSLACICEGTHRISTEDAAVGMEKPPHVILITETLPEEPPIKMDVVQTEITQTEISQLEITKTTMQVITQTVSDVETQTPSTPKVLKRATQPKIMTSATVDLEPEIMERLTRWKKISKDPSATLTVTVSSQTEKSSFLRMLQTLKSSGVYTKFGHEQELRSIQYGKRTEETEALCNCCMCGKSVPSNTPLDSRSSSIEETSSVIRILAALPVSSRPASPGTDQAVQHESICPVCKIKRLQMSLRASDTSRQLSTVVKRPTRDQQVTASVQSSRRPSLQSYKQKTDQSCMVRMTKIKVEKTRRIDVLIETVNVEMSTQETVGTQEEDKEERKMEDEDSVDCLCSTTMETEPEVVKKVRCACGDPD